MTEHIVRARNADHRVAVGWDQALESFYCRVWDRKHNELVAHLGTKDEKILDLGWLRKVVHRYGYFNEDLRQALQADREAARPAS